MKFVIILFAIVVTLLSLTNGVKIVQTQPCFKILFRLPKSKIEDIYFMDFDEAALTQPAGDILSCYLEQSHSGDKSRNQQLLDVYKKIDYYKRHDVTFGYKQLHKLESLGLPYSLENFLRRKIAAGDLMKRAVSRVQRIVGNEIELSSDYKKYKENIFSQYNSNITRGSSHRKNSYRYSKSNVDKNFKNHSLANKNSTMSAKNEHEYLENLREIVFGDL